MNLRALAVPCEQIKKFLLFDHSPMIVADLYTYNMMSTTRVTLIVDGLIYIQDDEALARAQAPY